MALILKDFLMNKLLTFSFIATLFAIFCSLSSATTLDEIRESSKTVIDQISSAHIVFFMERKYFNEFPNEKDANLDWATRKITELNRKYIIHEIDTIIDCDKQKAKSIYTDMRDINEIRKEYNLPLCTSIRIPSNYTLLIKNDYEMSYSPPTDCNGPNNAVMFLSNKSGNAINILNYPYFGIIDANLLDEKNNPQIMEITAGGQKLIQIDVSIEYSHGIIQCDPKYQYRFINAVWKNSKGEYSTEITAGDYRDINGIPYPFFYKYRRFVNGQLDKEEIYNVESVRFGEIFNESDFQILVPKGTALTDIAISHRSPVIGFERFMGIEDAMTMGKNLIQGP